MHAEGSVYGWTCENLLSPAWERYVRGRPTHELLNLLEETQWLEPEEMLALQLAKLRALLEHAQRNVPYYREIFAKVGLEPDDVRSPADLAVIPRLTKDIIRARYKDLVDPTYRGRNLKKGTSGSTGEPLKFEYSPESHAWRQATKMRGYKWGGYHVGSPSLHYWAQVYALPTGAAGLKLRLDRALKRETFIDSMKQDEHEMLEAVNILRRTRPSVIVCYTQSCAQWARFILDRGLRDWDDIPVLCGAEAVLPADRAVLTRAFGPDVFETYGSRETMLIAAECEAHDGMHLSDENLLVEITRNGAPVPDGASGEVIVTDLHNYGMPFIRYVNGDIARRRDPSRSRCACGRGLGILEHVDGRRADMLIGPKGEEIPGIVFHVLFSDARLEILKQFQVVQRPSREIHFFAVRGQDFTQERFDAILARFKGYLRGLPMRVELVDWIPPAANGKRKTILVER